LYPHTQITEKIISAAIEVHKILGPAYNEPIYQAALAHEFNLRQIPYVREKWIDVSYKGIIVGKYRLDFLVDDVILVELKAVSALSDVHLSQMLSYLQATSKKVGLIINFAQLRLVDGIKRVVL
jgi:GxxExxY protein